MKINKALEFAAHRHHVTISNTRTRDSGSAAAIVYAACDERNQLIAVESYRTKSCKSFGLAAVAGKERDRALTRLASSITDYYRAEAAASISELTLNTVRAFCDMKPERFDFVVLNKLHISVIKKDEAGDFEMAVSDYRKAHFHEALTVSVPLEFGILKPLACLKPFLKMGLAVGNALSIRGVYAEVVAISPDCTSAQFRVVIGNQASDTFAAA